MSHEHDWVDFDALIEVMPWGRNVFTKLRVDDVLERAAATARTRRIEGAIEEVVVNIGLNRANVIPDAFIHSGKGYCGCSARGRGTSCTVICAPRIPTTSPLADDLHRALTDSGRLSAFARRTLAERRRLLQSIEDAATSQARARRSAALFRTLLAD